MIDLAINFSAALSAALLFLVLWAFRRHALSTEDSALTDIVAGIFWLAASVLLRGAWWDGLRSAMGLDSFRVFYGFETYGFWPNIIFHAMVIGATLRLLRGFWYMIPEEDRSHYNVLTAAFYPRRIKLRFTRKDKKDG